jgi:serine/threonine protein phosphatase PrpC
VTALALECELRSDVGRRPNNEDTVFATTRLAIVADGVGGAEAGEVASRTIVNALVGLEKRRLNGGLADALADAVARGNAMIGFIAECRPEMAGMSTTLTAVALDDDGTYVLANVGDSRTYLFRDGQLTLLTHDDSLVQLMVDRGEITADQARGHPHRSVVLEALDGTPERRPTVTFVTARPGDRLLLCSDGLSDFVDDETLAHALAHPSRRASADHLIELALGAGGSDNVSLVIADVVQRRDPHDAWRL